jgi:hypothetical protein
VSPYGRNVCPRQGSRTRDQWSRVSRLTTSAVEDRELLARLKAGETTAFDTIFRANYALLVRVAESMLRERATAEEIAQDVMLELWRRREALDETAR